MLFFVTVCSLPSWQCRGASRSAAQCVLARASRSAACAYVRACVRACVRARVPQWGSREGEQRKPLRDQKIAERIWNPKGLMMIDEKNKKIKKEIWSTTICIFWKESEIPTFQIQPGRIKRERWRRGLAPLPWKRVGLAGGRFLWFWRPCFLSLRVSKFKNAAASEHGASTYSTYTHTRNGNNTVFILRLCDKSANRPSP